MLAVDGRAVTEAMSRNWWLFLIRGVLAIIFGIMAWAWPGLTLGTLIWISGFWLVFDGVFALMSAVFNRNQMDRVWPVVLMGIAGIVAGVFIMAYPGFTAVWLIVTIGFYAIFSGVFGMFNAFRLRKEIENEWSMALFGLISVVFGVMMIAFPGSGALSLIWVIGIYAIMIGIAEIVFAFRVRNIA